MTDSGFEQLNECCDSFLSELNPDSPQPVTCPACKKDIIFSTSPMSSQMTHEITPKNEWNDEGKCIVNPRYV